MKKFTQFTILFFALLMSACTAAAEEIVVPEEVEREAFQTVRNFFALASESIGFDYELDDLIVERVENIPIDDVYTSAGIENVWCSSVSFSLRTGLLGILNEWVNRILVVRVFQSADNQWVSEIAGNDLSEESLPADMPIEEMAQVLWDACLSQSDSIPTNESS
jgi:hypothetical protein